MSTIDTRPLFNEFFPDTSSYGFTLILGAVCFALFLFFCFICLISILVAYCCNHRRKAKDLTLQIKSPKCRKYLIQRYNDVKIEPKGIDGPQQQQQVNIRRDAPDGSTDPKREHVETKPTEITQDPDVIKVSSDHNNVATINKGVKLQRLERLKVETPICQVLDQTPKRPKAPPPIPRRISSLYRTHAGVMSPKSPGAVMNSSLMLDMGTTHL